MTPDTACTNQPATAHANDDYNDAHGRRLLIARAGRLRLLLHGLVAVSAFQKKHCIRPARVRTNTGRTRLTLNRCLQLWRA